MKQVAILIDGTFFLKRFRYLYRGKPTNDPRFVAKKLQQAIYKHLRLSGGKHSKSSLYRVFYYDCPPIEKPFQHPVTKKRYETAKQPDAVFRKSFYKELTKLRKFALRKGRLSDNVNWIIKPDITKQLLSGKKELSDLDETDVFLDFKQKQVDMKMGLDIASLAYKKDVDQIILIAGDSDFVPAAKHARREGLDVIVDSMWNKLAEDLFEHIDGLQSSVWPNPNKPPQLVKCKEPPVKRQAKKS